MQIKWNGFRDPGENSLFVLSCGVVLVYISEYIVQKWLSVLIRPAELIIRLCHYTPH